MDIDQADIETQTEVSEESAKILDEMDRLLGEMQGTMKIIKQLIDDEAVLAAIYPAGHDSHAEKEVVHSR
jgi:hypothetical protein